MNDHVATRYLVFLLLGLGMISTLVVQAQSQSFDKQVELKEAEGIKHRLPIDFHVQPGQHAALTVTGNQLFHDALIITTKNGGVEVDLDLVVLCPDSRQKFAKRDTYPSQRYNNYSLFQEKSKGWKLEFGKDCNVAAQDLGYPTIALTTLSLAWIEVSRSGTVRAKEMVTAHVRIDMSGLAAAELDHVQAERVDITVTGSSNLSIASLEANTSQVSLSGLADFDLDSIVSPKVEFDQSGSSDSNTTNLVTDRIVITVDGLSTFVAGKIQTPGDQANSSGEVSAINLSGSADVTVQSLRLPQLELKADGLSDLDLGQTVTNRLKLSASGSSDVSFTSLTTEESQIDTSGLADVEVETLDSDVFEIQASGSAHVEVQKATAAHMDVRSTGLSDVSIKSKERTESNGAN
ncbi:MAG: DUF2807 domain-containing protein [Gammaproteobacteria bacterium]|nr:DUF2807 domain-containing protein [Gammaproteobacteria bacterium]